MIHITLPFPHAGLNPNKILHWTKKAKLKKDAALCVQEAFYNSGLKNILRVQMNSIDRKVVLLIIFYPPDKRGRDIDNLLASMKPHLDQLAKCIGINDKQFRPITIDMGEPDKKNPRVEITID